MTATQPAWLTQHAYERLKEELARLLAQRIALSGGGGSRPVSDRDSESTVDQFFADQREIELRIRRLQETLRDPVIGQDPPDDGIAEPGMVLTVCYGDEADTETFLLADRDQGVYGDIETYSPSSPLGSALFGARQGEQRTYHLPNGTTMTVTLLRAVPYESSQRLRTPR